MKNISSVTNCVLVMRERKKGDANGKLKHDRYQHFIHTNTFRMTHMQLPKKRISYPV